MTGFSSASKIILEAYGDAAKYFNASTRDLELFKSMLAPNQKFVELALWWKTGRESALITAILETTTQLVFQDLGRWWYSAHLDGEDVYRGLLE